MKKPIAIILLSVLLIENLHFLYFKYLQENIKQEIETEIEDYTYNKNFFIITVPKENLNKIIWIKKDREFVYNGSLFDIIRIKENSKSKSFYCVNDIKEKNLISSYFNTNSKRKSIFLIIKNIITNKYLPSVFINTKNIICQNIRIDNYINLYSFQIIKIISPPPKKITHT